jgi:eukaryotic-like serine/threonine-protein kinase
VTVQIAFGVGGDFAGRYRLIEHIGDGGMGTVWRAHDRTLDIEVALKLQRGPAPDREEMLARFAQEGELSARMFSPNIVRVVDRGVDERGVPYIAYELLTGDELGARLAREGRLSLAICADLIVQSCRALARAHTVGVLHLDIKPENIFLCEEDGEDGRTRPLVKILDFGIARLQGPDAERGQASGTVQYMSPEVLLDGRSPDARSDLYALGVVAYECFTGRLPYRGESLGEVLLEHAQSTPPAPSTLRPVTPDLATALDAWFKKALRRDPAERFQTAKEMAEAFVGVHRPQRTSIAPDGPKSAPSSGARAGRSSFPSLSGIDLRESTSSKPPPRRSGPVRRKD